jgi:hypothetical protein
MTNFRFRCVGKFEGKSMRIELEAITGKHEVKCPSCSNDIYHLFPDRSAVPGSRYFITDGDSVPGVWLKLRDDQKDRACAQTLEVGTCHNCGETYHFATAALIDVVNDDQHADPYLLLNADLGKETNYLCRAVDGSAFIPEQWFLQEYATDIGPMHYHYLGPFKTEDDSAIRTWAGVTSCGRNGNTDPDDPWVHASQVLLTSWDAMLLLIRATTDKFTFSHDNPNSQS